MRRFASVFLPKREKRESQKHPPQPLGVTTLKIQPVTTPSTSLPPTPQLVSRANDNAQSSSSSTASGSIQTPDEESPLSRSFTKKSWKSWLGTVKSGTLKRAHRNNSRVSIIGDGSEQRFDSDYPLPPVPPIQPPPPGYKPTSSSASRRESTQHPPPGPNPSRGPDFPSVPVVSRVHDIAPLPFDPRPVSDGGLWCPLSPRPFVNVVGSPLFPRSCNSRMPPQDTLSSTMFRTRLLRRLTNEFRIDDPDAQAFTSRHLDQPRVQVQWQADIPSIPSRQALVSGSSTGIRHWMSRPCFEDRFIVWLPDNGTIVRKPVAGTSFAVLDLEYSTYLEAVAGFELGLPTETDPPMPVLENLAAAEVSNVHIPYSAAPSPLRREHSPAPREPLDSSPTSCVAVTDRDACPPSSESSSETSPTPPDSQVPEVKRGVRWAEDVSDRVPLGYAQRMKKRRADKVRFLREEQSRRALENERKKIEDARRLLEHEKRLRERERAALQREREALERERRQKENLDMEKKERQERALREEVINARTRREAQRAGKSPTVLRESAHAGLDDGLGPTSHNLYGAGSYVASSSVGSLREGSRERNNLVGDKRASRLSHDPNMQPLHRPPMPSRPSSTSLGHTLSPTSAYGPLPGTRSSNSNSGSSPGSSRPPSISAGGPLSSHLPSSASHDHSDESSIHKKRHSISSTATRPDIDRAITLPNYPPFFGSPMQVGWNSSHPSLNGMVMAPINPMMGQMNTMMFPGVNMVPYMDLPLLPPTPPFMMQQYRRSSAHSSTSSRDQSLERGSRQRESSQGSGRSSGSEHQHPRPVHNDSNPSSPHHGSPHSRRGSADMSPSSFHMPKRTSSGLSLDRRPYQTGASSSSSSLLHGVATSSHKHSQASTNHERAYSDRGRPMHPGQSTRNAKGSVKSQSPSPWTALPTQDGTLPQYMPTTQAQRQRDSQVDQSRHWTKPSASRRQTAFP